MIKHIRTRWTIREYDTWGNEEDGYSVNDVYTQAENYPLRLQVKQYNVGSPLEFSAASPSDCQIRRALGINKKVKLDCEGDDTHIYVNGSIANCNMYPLGELICTSHDSLSPIRRNSFNKGD